MVGGWELSLVVGEMGIVTCGGRGGNCNLWWEGGNCHL